MSAERTQERKFFFLVILAKKKLATKLTALSFEVKE